MEDAALQRGQGRDFIPDRRARVVPVQGDGGKGGQQAFRSRLGGGALGIPGVEAGD